MRGVWCALVALGVGAMLVACQQLPREAREPTPLDLTTVGTIAGVVRFEGTVPPQTEVQVGSSAKYATLHDGPVLAGDVLVATGKVQNAIVYIADGLGDRVLAVSETPVVIDQGVLGSDARTGAAPRTRRHVVGGDCGWPWRDARHWGTRRSVHAHGEVAEWSKARAC